MKVNIQFKNTTGSQIYLIIIPSDKTQLGKPTDWTAYIGNHDISGDPINVTPNELTVSNKTTLFL